MLYGWLVLMHSIGERVKWTMLASPLTYVGILLTCALILLQRKDGIFRELCTIIAVLGLFFIYLIILFNILICSYPTTCDFIFYYECFIVVFLGITPLYFVFRLYWR